MSLNLPSYVTTELQSSETLISYIPEPNLNARKRIILAIFPVFVVVVILLIFVVSEQKKPIAGAAGVYCAVALFILVLRLCRTSYIISATRVVRFVGGKKIEDVEFAESKQPALIDLSASNSFLARCAARFVSLGQTVEVNRLRPKPSTVAGFVSGRDPSRMRIGYPGHGLPIARILHDMTLAWEAAQSRPKATS